MHTYNTDCLLLYLFSFYTDPLFTTVSLLSNILRLQKGWMERWDRGREGQVIQEQGRGIHLHTNCFSFSLSQEGEKDHLSPSETPVSLPLLPPPPSLLCESSVNGEPHSLRMNGMGWIWVGGNSDHHSPPMPEPHVQRITI